ncbi:hypothetical protein G7A79_20140 [Coprococcus sp. MSK.21.13]|nr:hypothetical protein [Coprococcus sp. MSK.21.13]
MLAAIIISAIILFRDDTKEGVHEGGTFTEKMTEGTTERKADVKTTSKATTTEKATKAATSEKSKKGSAKTAKKDKKGSATTTESTTKKPGSPATTEAKTPGREDGKVTTSQQTTETPTEKPTTAATTERATTERPTTEKPKPEQATTEHVHTWKDVYETQEKKVCVSEAWDEDVQELHSFCSYCGKDITYDGNHIFNCGEKYYSESLGEEIYEGSRAVTRYVTVDTIHHSAEYEIQKEKVFVGRKCSTCGAWQ